jgi:hypothetical protein
MDKVVRSGFSGIVMPGNQRRKRRENFMDKNSNSIDYWNSTIFPKLVDTFFVSTNTSKSSHIYFNPDLWLYLYDDGGFVYESAFEE